ncbi:MAG TPA: hypothetical protein VFW24_14690 [Acidimicrobiales bacterium]|nr:hypothetical protein [Acidimicrobiales bacterium]
MTEWTRLERAVSEALSGHGGARLVAVDQVVRRSTHPTLVAVVRTGAGTELSLFVKHGRSTPGQRLPNAPRGGLVREAAVYREILASVDSSAPRFHGTYTDETGETWLFVEHVEAACRVAESADETAPARTMRWLGRFHARAEPLLGRARLLGLPRQGAASGLEWAERAVDFSRELHGDYPWLDGLRSEVVDLLMPLRDLPETVIHFEFVPDNVLHAGHRVVPVDWESAAIGPGVLDLAFFTDDWAGAALEDDYIAARWAGGPAPAGFPDALAAARLFMNLRWLGDDPEMTVHPGARWRFGALEAAWAACRRVHSR